MKCIEHNEMSCAMKCLVQWNMQGLKQWMNPMKQWMSEMKQATSAFTFWTLVHCQLFIGLTVLWGQEVRELWEWLKCRCNPGPWMWLPESLVGTAPVSLHPAPGHGQAGKVRINSCPAVHQVTCATVLCQKPKYHPSNLQPSPQTLHRCDLWASRVFSGMSVGSHSPAFGPWQGMNASMVPKTLWNTWILHSRNTQQSPGILPWIFSPSPTESTSAPDFCPSLGACRLNPYSERPRMWRTVMVGSREKPQDRWLVCRTGISCEWFHWIFPISWAGEKKSSPEPMGKEHSSVL